MTPDPEPIDPPAPRKKAKTIRQALTVVAIMLVGAVFGWGASVIQNQSNTIDRRSVTIDYLREDNAWSKCLLRQDVRYKQAFLGAVIALQEDDEAKYDRLVAEAEAQLERYRNIDTVCPPPAAPVDPTTGN